MLRKAENPKALLSRTFPYVKIRHSFLVSRWLIRKLEFPVKNEVN